MTFKNSVLDGLSSYGGDVSSCRCPNCNWDLEFSTSEATGYDVEVHGLLMSLECPHCGYSIEVSGKIDYTQRQNDNGDWELKCQIIEESQFFVVFYLMNGQSHLFYKQSGSSGFSSMVTHDEIYGIKISTTVNSNNNNEYPLAYIVKGLHAQAEKPFNNLFINADMFSSNNFLIFETKMDSHKNTANIQIIKHIPLNNELFKRVFIIILYYNYLIAIKNDTNSEIDVNEKIHEIP